MPSNPDTLADGLPIQWIYNPDRPAMPAALRVVLGLPRQLPPVFPDALLSDGNQSDRCLPDRTGPNGTEGPGQEDES